MGADALWNRVSRPPETPVDLPRELLERAAAGESGQLRAIEVALAWLESVYPHAGALCGLGAPALRDRMLIDVAPVPTPADREGYFAANDLAYWLSGLADRLLLERLATDRGRPLCPGQRVLDLGCASGRVLRHLHGEPGFELLGIELGDHHVRWARRHLPPEIVVSLGTVVPAFPLEDRSVDVLSAFSVLTHADDLEEALLLEIRRVLSPDGFAFVTYHPARVWDAMRKDPDHFLRRVILGSPHRVDPPGTEPVTASLFASPLAGERVVFTDLERDVYNTNVIHAERWVRERWGTILRLERIVERTHGDHQDGVVLSRGGACTKALAGLGEPSRPASPSAARRA